MVTNLVSNAINYNKPGGEVRVSTSRDNGAAILTVTDTGEGIAPENLSKIFDPFFTTKPEGKGVGLGLAVLYGIIEAHGGEVDVVSALGKGTTFTITLPLTAVEKPNVVLPITALSGQLRYAASPAPQAPPAAAMQPTDGHPRGPNLS